MDSRKVGGALNEMMRQFWSETELATWVKCGERVKLVEMMVAVRVAFLNHDPDPRAALAGKPLVELAKSALSEPGLRELVKRKGAVNVGLATMHAVSVACLAIHADKPHEYPRSFASAVERFEKQFGALEKPKTFKAWCDWCANVTEESGGRAIAMMPAADDELRRVFTEYATDVMGFAPFGRKPVETVPLVDLEGARRAWVSDGTFADEEPAVVQLRARRNRQELEFEVEAHERRVKARLELEKEGVAEPELFKNNEEALERFLRRMVKQRTDGDTAYVKLGRPKVDTAFDGAFKESRKQAVYLVALRRAMALGFDPRVGEPAALFPGVKFEEKADATAANVSLHVTGFAGKGAFKWDDQVERNVWMGRVFAHCGPSGAAASEHAAQNRATPLDADEEDALSECAPLERKWRLTLLRATGSDMLDVDAATAYSEFRRIWRAHHASPANPPAELCAEDPVAGQATFAELLAMRRGGSLAEEFLRNAVRALPGAGEHARRIDTLTETSLWGVWCEIRKQGRSWEEALQCHTVVC